MAKATKEQFLGLLIMLILVLPLLFLLYWPGQRLILVACNVGQGDALLISKGFLQILIDGGPDDQVLNCLTENMPFWDRTIELAVNTHPDKDHLGGLVEVLARYEINQILANNQEVKTQVWQQFHQLVEEEQIPLYSPQKGEKIKIGGLEFTVLWPKTRITGSEQILGAESKEKTNEDSIVLHLQYEDFDALFTGDITSKEEKEIIKDYQFNNIEVLKVAHHGSKYSSSPEFLQAVKPKTAIISAGKNPWGHPTKEVLTRLEQIGAEILRTDSQEIKLKIK